jgi:hypothetical protein
VPTGPCSVSKTASVRGDRNGTQRDGQRRLHLRIRGKMGLAERTGMECNRSPMLGKQQLMNAKTSQSLLPCEGVGSRSACYNRIASRPYHVLLRHGLMLLWTMSFMLILQQRDDTASSACARARPSLVLSTQTWYILYPARASTKRVWSYSPADAETRRCVRRSSGSACRVGSAFTQG